MSDDLIQGSPEWLQARCGSLGASQVNDALAKTRSGWGAGRANIMAQLICERLTGQPTEGFVSPAMARGNEVEPDARAAYCFAKDVDVVEVGLVKHPFIKGTHASPDGLVGDDGLVEFKCPSTANHIDTLLSQKIPAKYITQMQWQLACTGRRWCDFVSFDPRLPPEMSLYVERVERDGPRIAEMEQEVQAFLSELATKLDALNRLYGVQQEEAA